MLIRLRCSDLTFTPELLSREVFVSPSTGSTLHKLSVSLTASTEQSKALAADITKEARTLESLDEQGNSTTTWTPRLVRQSYSNNDPTHTFIWELTEKEQVTLQELRLNDFVIVPYEYVETFDAEGMMTIDARARLSAGEIARLRDLPHFFSVIRKGISDTPREMRFGKLLWSDHGEYVKHDLLLVDKSPRDDRKISELFQPEIWNMQGGIARTSCLMKNLLDTLQAKGVLDNDAIEGIRQRSDAEMADRIRQFTQVDDLDKWA